MNTNDKKPIRIPAAALAAAEKYLRGYKYDDARVLAAAMLEFAVEYAAGKAPRKKR